jgi:hypothetical protein
MSSWGTVDLHGETRIDRPASTQTAIRQKEAERQEILSAVEIFLAQGGSIQTIPTTVSKEAQLGEMRAGRVGMISAKEIARRWRLSAKVIPSVLAKWPTLMYIMDGTDRLYCLADIERVEKQPGYKLHKNTV